MTYRTLAHTDDIGAAVDHSLQVAEGYLDQAARRGIPLQGVRVLELGPGGDFGAALILAGHGADLTLADRYLARWNPAWHPRFYALLRERIQDRHPTGPLDAVIASGRCEDVLALHKRGIQQLTRLPAGAFDLTLSNAVLEHVRDIGGAARALARLTASGGTGLHQIDFRDHRDGERPLESLTLGPLRFALLWAARRGGCGNRRRHTEFAEAFLAAGLTIEEFEPNLFADDAYVDDVRPRCHAHFRDMPREALATLSGRFTLRKP